MDRGALAQSGNVRWVDSQCCTAQNRRLQKIRCATLRFVRSTGRLLCMHVDWPTGSHGRLNEAAARVHFQYSPNLEAAL